ncbi:MAG TPA: MGMT family protein [Candidatus Paceibacterota bacterium]|nr:MGMT family protein [Candidatus Paceibacterota bacterium]
MKKNKPHRSSSKDDVQYSPFAKKVRAVVAKIPKGQVMTYAMVAKKAGNAGAARAVGYWMSKNFDPKIPCHRVIRADGTIGNYNRGGEKAKRALLKKEGAII